MSNARLHSEHFEISSDERMRRIAAAKGKTIYRGLECSINGHGDRRYVKTTGCVVCSDARARKKAKGLSKAPRGRSSTPEYRMWISARNRADEKGLEFTITIDDIMIPSVCPVFGIPMVNPSLDRFDNSCGYTPDNIRVISRRANTIKSDATLSEILAVARYMQSDNDFEALLG